MSKTSRRAFILRGLVGSQAVLAGCGGGSASGESLAQAPASGQKAGGASNPSTTTGPTSSPAPSLSAYSAYDSAAPSSLPTIRITAAATGTWPYCCTLMPLPGQLPANATFTSPDDSNLALSVLNTWPDGSAAVAVAAGKITVSAVGTRSVRLEIATPSGAPNLTAQRVAALVNEVSIAFDTLGTARLSDLSRPERIWWANAQVICARYRLAVPSHPTLEAIIDVHAYADAFAFVEVVLENGKMNTASPVKTPGAAYSAAAVSVNGRVLTTVSSAGAAEGSHSSFRAWYAAGWTGSDPSLHAWQDSGSLQLHPLFWKLDAATPDLSRYSTDSYAPWGYARQRGTWMGAGGDHPSIGPLPQWEVQFLQTGDPRAATAVVANALSVLGFNVNYRDVGTGLVPTISDLAGKSQQNNWPSTGNSGERMTWEVAHHPAAGLTAFICRPSPVFIEIAQKVAVFNATYTTFQDVGPLTSTGVFGQYYQIRGRAWCLRSLTHATFLTPGTLPWRAAGISSLAANTAFLDGWRLDTRAKLNCFWDYASGNGSLYDADSAAGGFQSKVWQHHYLTTELHRAASVKLLAGGAQSTLQALADWAAGQPVRWINEQPNGAWRYVPYHTTIGRSPTSIDSLDTWGAQLEWSMSDGPVAVSGPWKTDYSGNTRTTYASFDSTDTTAGASYPSYLWAALVVAVERGVPGSRNAWETVQANITGISTWQAGFAADPRWGFKPRNV